MPFTRVNPGDLIQAQNLNQVLGSLNGTAGQGVPITQTSVNDASNYALSVQNLEATNSRAINIVKSDGTLLIRGDATGVSLGSPLNLTAGSIGTAPIADGAITNAKLGPDVARANLLSNGGFEIWQRGNGPFTANVAYSADRWLVNLGGTSTYSITRDTTNVDANSGAALAMTYTHNAATDLQQKLEDLAQLKGRTLSFSVRVRTSTANAVQAGIWDSVNSYRLSSFHTGDGTYQTLSVTAPVAAATSQVIVALRLFASCTLYVDNASLVVGSQAANYVPLHPADDLARCLRYYEVIPAVSEGGYLAVLQCFAATGANGVVRLKTTKAVNPTVTITSVGSFQCQLAGGGNAACTALTTGVSNPNSVTLTATVGSGLVAGNATLMNLSTGAGYITVEANP